MDRPSSSSKPRRQWHRLVEHYTPDGVLGRLLFAAAMGPVVTFFVWLAAVGITTYGIISLLLTLFATVAGIGVTLLGIVVLWPVYLSFIGNIESPEAYANARSTSSPELADSDDSIALLKRRYAAGEMGDEEFEHRLDTLLEVGDSTPSESSNPSHVVDTDVREYDRN